MIHGIRRRPRRRWRAAALALLAGAVLALFLPSAAFADASSASVSDPGSWRSSSPSPERTLAPRQRLDRSVAPHTGPLDRLRSSWTASTRWTPWPGSQTYLLLAAVTVHDGVSHGVAAPVPTPTPPPAARPSTAAAVSSEPVARPSATTSAPSAVGSTVGSAAGGPAALPRTAPHGALALVGPLDSRGMGTPWLVGGACAALVVLAGVLRAARQERGRSPALR